jgi:hypothetical protein
MAGKVKTEQAAISTLRKFVEDARAGEARLVSLEQSLKQRKSELALLRQQAEKALSDAVDHRSLNGVVVPRPSSSTRRRS